MVSPELQIFKCFGCGKGGDAFKFLMEYENIEFGEALRILAEKTGIKLKSFKPSDKQKQKEKIFEVNHLSSEFYQYILTKHKVGKKALEYLLKRGVSKDSIKLFKIGYAPDEWEGLSRFLTKKKKYRQDDLQEAGLAVKGKHGVYDRFRGRVIFPIFDHRGRIVAFSGRVLPGDDTQQGKYINSPETKAYHKSQTLYGLWQTKKFLKKTQEAVVVEGELDLISSLQAGVKNAVAIKGSAFTPEQIDLLKRYVERLVLALDADQAGQEATKRSIQLAEKADLEVRVAKIKGGKDPDDIAQSDPKKWRQLVKKSISIYDFYINSAIQKHGLKTGQAKKKVSQAVVPILAQVDNEVLKAHYLKKLAQELEVDQEVVVSELRKIRVGARNKKTDSGKKTQVQMTRQEKLEHYILGVILKSGQQAKAWLKNLDLKVFSHSGIKKVLSKLDSYLEKKPLKISEFVSQLPDELQDLSQTAYLKEADQEPDIADFKKALLDLKKLDLQKQMDEISQKIKNLERSGKDEKVAKMQTKFAQLSKTLKDYS